MDVTTESHCCHCCWEAVENWSQRVVIFLSAGAIKARCSDLWCSTVSPHCRCEKIFCSLSWPPAELMGMWLQSLTWQTSVQTSVHSLFIFKSCSVRCLLFRIKQYLITREGKCHGNATVMYFFCDKSLYPVRCKHILSFIWSECSYFSTETTHEELSYIHAFNRLNFTCSKVSSAACVTMAMYTL